MSKPINQIKENKEPKTFKNGYYTIFKLKLFDLKKNDRFGNIKSLCNDPENIGRY